MKLTLLFPIALTTLCLILGGCDKPTVNVGAPAVAVPGPAGPAGATGKAGETGKQGAPAESTTVIVTPTAPAED